MRKRTSSRRALAFRMLLFGATLGLIADASPKARRTNAFASASPVAASSSRWSGTVLERIATGSYVYLRVARDDGSSAWVVTMEALAPDTTRVRVHVLRRSEQFDSPRLHRSFSPLFFGIVRKDAS
jgi:hypothetical protein